MDTWVCTICGYIYEGDNPPTECPLCDSPGAEFHPRSENQTEKS